MITKAFNEAFGTLVGAFKHHQDVPRDGSNIAELGTARWNLEIARRTARRERLSIEHAAHERDVIAQQVAMSGDDLARLRVQGSGFTT